MQKDRPPDWQDTNLSLFGSDIEKKCKEAAANSEPQWDGAGMKPGLQIWRIEQFRVKPWPKSKYGRFHVGDSYIILNTYVKDPTVNPDKLAWDVHFWIGSESTQDEYGTAAYKTVELDDRLRGAAVQHREVQEAESELFLSYFGGHQVMYLDGGAASGFKVVTEEVRPTRLFWLKGRANNLLLKEVKVRRDSMNSGDVFILDTEDGIWQWSGKEANAHERSKGAAFCAALKADRGGKVGVATLVEGESEGDPTDANDPFWRHLPGERKLLGVKVADIKVRTSIVGGDDESVKAFEPTLFRLSDRIVGGGVAFSKVGAGRQLPVSLLQSADVFILDTGFEIYIWVGHGASQSEKVSAFPYAQKYLKDYKRPPVLPITRYAEGKEPPRFLELFGPPEAKGGCCCAIS
mmetsp:Transcript_13234/g.26859  ORF Transcript_13234/g.26859 Transcript_13234/m.26859 type:complete len:405 (+) Transcript_13234:42-1256(+)